MTNWHHLSEENKSILNHHPGLKDKVNLYCVGCRGVHVTSIPVFHWLTDIHETQIDKSRLKDYLDDLKDKGPEFEPILTKIKTDWGLE